MDLGGPKEPCIRRGPDPPWEGAILRGEGAAIATCCQITLTTCSFNSEMPALMPLRVICWSYLIARPSGSFFRILFMLYLCALYIFIFCFIYLTANKVVY